MTEPTAFGLKIDASHLPEGCTPLEVVLSVKMLDAEGGVALYDCASEGLNTWEAIGMAVVLQDRLRKALLEANDED